MKSSFWKRFQLWRRAEDDEVLLRGMAIGINSGTDITRDEHVLMLDFDVKDIKRVVDSVHELQEFWRLADAFVFRTTNGFHVFFWYDQMPYGRVKQIVEFARDVDPMFKYISRYYDHKTIRVIGKHKKRDIFFERSVSGVRVPSPEQVEVGELKMKEHKQLLEMGK